MAAKSESDCCSICLDDYKDPKILPCQHVFCHQCLEDYVQKKKNNQITCPNCTVKVDIPPGGVAALQNYAEESVPKSTKPKDCDVCEKGINASFQCFECNKYMCEACKKFHDVFSSKHRVHKFDESKISYCKNHPKVVPEFFCTTCSSLICQDCKDDGHKPDHLILEIQDYFTERKTEFQECLKEIDKKLNNVETVTQKFIRQQETKAQNVIARMTKLQADLKADMVEACHTERMNSEKDKVLSNRLAAVIQHLETASNKSNDQNELISLILDLQSKIKTHKKYFLRTRISEIIYRELGNLDATIGQLFEFYQSGSSFNSRSFFLGGIHWSVSIDNIQQNNDNTTSLTLNSFCREEDEHYVESITINLVFTLILYNGNSVVKEINKIFSARSNNLKFNFLKHDTCYNTNLKILFDILYIKEVKYWK